MPPTMRTLLAVALWGLLLIWRQRTEAAATTNGELLTFYPISAMQYSSLINLMHQQQPVIPERSVTQEGHGSLAQWSKALPSGWNDMFDLSRYNGGADMNYGGGVKGYPLCVLKANATQVRRKRGSRQYNFGYAGLAPKVMYNTVPLYRQYEPFAVSPTAEVPAGKSVGNAEVNCVMVLRHDPKITAAAAEQQPQMFVPPHGYAYPSSLFGANSPYGSYTPAPAASSAVPAASVRQAHPQTVGIVNPYSQRIYQDMLNNYYQQLGRLYAANAVANGRPNLPTAGRGYLQLERVNEADDNSYEDDDEYDEVDNGQQDDDGDEEEESDYNAANDDDYEDNVIYDDANENDASDESKENDQKFEKGSTGSEKSILDNLPNDDKSADENEAEEEQEEQDKLSED